MQIKDTFENVMVGLGEAAKDAVQDYLDEIADNVADRERNFGIQNAVEAFLEAKTNDDDIIRYLEKYWGMNDAEAMDAVSIIKTQVHPENELKYYLKKQGYSEREIRDFVVSNHVGLELRRDHELWKLTPANLVERLKKKA